MESRAYSTSNGDIHIIRSDGTDAHKLATWEAAYSFSWSPDGRNIRFPEKGKSLWEITSSGSNLHQLLAGWHPSEGKCCGGWSPDGEFFSSGPRTPTRAQIYALDERRGYFRPPSKEPFQLTSGPLDWGHLAFSKDGKKIFAAGYTKLANWSV